MEARLKLSLKDTSKQTALFFFRGRVSHAELLSLPLWPYVLRLSVSVAGGPWTCLGSTFGKIYANRCCLNTRGPPKPFHPTQHITTGWLSNKASRLVSLPLGPPDSLYNSFHSLHSVPALPGYASQLCEWQVNEEKIFLQDRISTKPWEPMAAFLWASALRLGTFISLSSLDFMDKVSCFACPTLTTHYWFAARAAAPISAFRPHPVLLQIRTTLQPLHVCTSAAFMSSALSKVWQKESRRFRQECCSCRTLENK